MPHWLDRLFGREEKSALSSRLIALTAGTRSAWSPRALPAMMQAGYARNAIVHRCVRLTAEAAASVPLAASDTAITRLLDMPNPDQSGPELWESLYGYLQLAGNAYLELASLADEPRALHLLRPDRMRVLAGPTGWPDGWEYAAAGRKRRFQRDRVSGRSPVFHIRLFHPGDDHYGLSPLEAVGRALDLHTAGSDWARALLDNAARPSGALVFKGENGQLSPDQFERLKAELEASHTGAANAGRPLLLEGGLDWTPMALSPAEMDFTTARREAAREIALGLGVPPLLLGLPGDNTHANYAEANAAFLRQTVRPLVMKMARALSVWLRPWSAPDLEIRPDFAALEEAGEARHA